MEGANGVEGGEKGGPPPPSPLTGCYLLVVIGEPNGDQHKDIILQRIAKGLLSWDINSCLVDLEKELAIVTEQALEGEEARYGERLIQFASENLVTEILIHPVVSTLAQCMRNLLSSFTRHRHIIHAGYTFAGNGSWALQDGTFSYADFAEAFQETEVQRVIRAYENGITLDIHCSPEGDWPRLPREPFAKASKVRVNPIDVLTSGSIAINNFTNYLAPFLVPNSLECLLESSDVVGNIRFSRPTLYVFPGGQGDAALFGINGFNMLLDGGFSRKACFWDFVRHLDRLDAVLMTRLNNSNIGGVSSVLRRKKQDAVYPQIGHFFCNIQERKSLLSPDGDKDKDPLLINLLDEGQEIISNLRHLNLNPQVCYRDSEPINLYHKVGHGTLDMYVLSPAKDAKEVRDFLQKWNQSDQKLFTNAKSSREFNFPIQNLVSIAALLVWQPANPNDTITRILFPGSSPQRKIFEGLDRLKNLEFIKHPICTEKSLVPISITKKTAIIEKVKEKTPVDKKESKIIENNVTAVNSDVKEKTVRKSDSTESERSTKTKKLDEPKIIENGGEKPKSKPKPAKFRSDSQQRKKPQTQKASPTTPKKTIENGEAPKKPSKPSPISTPAKSAKDANNRKVIESKSRQAATKPPPIESKPKPERKPISRRPKAVKAPVSPIKKLVNGVQKPESISRKARLDKEGTTDSSTVSTPSADQESILKKDISKLTPEEIQQLKAQELADLKEEQEAIKEIEAVFRKSESQPVEDTSLRKVKDDSIEEKLEKEEYIIIEKEEILHDSLNEKGVREDETQKLARDSEESEKQRKLSGEEQMIEKLPEIQDQVNGIVAEAEDIVRAKDELVTSKVTSPEEKLDSTDKKTTDKEVEEEVKDVVESQPEEKVSVNIKSGDTTTAPTLPEDERIPLDEIKEDNGQIIEEKHVKEDTKEKEVPVIQLPPKPLDAISKLPNVVGIRLDKQSHIRDIVKTPDEVADLPVHEEVDYEYTQDLKPDMTKTNEILTDEKALDSTKRSKEQEKEIEQEKDKDEVVQQQISDEGTDIKKHSAMLDELKTLTDTVLKNESAIEKDILKESEKPEEKEILKPEIKEKSDDSKYKDEDDQKNIKTDDPLQVEGNLQHAIKDIKEKDITLIAVDTGKYVETSNIEAAIVQKKEHAEEPLKKTQDVAIDSDKENNEKGVKDMIDELKDIPAQSLKTESQQMEHSEKTDNVKMPEQPQSEGVKEIEQLIKHQFEHKVEITDHQIVEEIDNKQDKDIKDRDATIDKDYDDKKEIEHKEEKYVELDDEKSVKIDSIVKLDQTAHTKDCIQIEVNEEDTIADKKNDIIEQVHQKPIPKTTEPIDETHQQHLPDTLDGKISENQEDDKKTEAKDRKSDDKTVIPSYEDIEIEVDKIDDEFIQASKESRDRLTEIDDQLKHLKEAFSREDGFGKPKAMESDEVERKVELLHERGQITNVDIIEKIELGRKSPKEREEDVIKIVASVAEVLKSDAPLEEFEGKLPVSTYAPYSQSYTTELRETHITTVDSPIVESKPIRSDTIPPIPEEPHIASASFLEEERKISIVHTPKEPEKLEDTEDKRSNLLKESQELLKATSKMISEIKASKADEKTEEKTEAEEKIDEDDVCAVHRMLVTASSEDGGEETEICPAGSITFSKSSESSGRSSPEQSQRLSQKSSIVDTISDTFSTVKQVRDLCSEKDSGIDDTKSESEDTKITTITKDTEEVSSLAKGVSQPSVSEKSSPDKDASIKSLASGKSTPDISDFEKSKEVDEATRKDEIEPTDKLPEIKDKDDISGFTSQKEKDVKDHKEAVIEKIVDKKDLPSEATLDKQIPAQDEIKDTVGSIVMEKTVSDKILGADSKIKDTISAEEVKKEEQKETLNVIENIEEKPEEIMKPVEEEENEASIIDEVTDIVKDTIEVVGDTTKHVMEDISKFVDSSDKSLEDKFVMKKEIDSIMEEDETAKKQKEKDTSIKESFIIEKLEKSEETVSDSQPSSHQVSQKLEDLIKDEFSPIGDTLKHSTNGLNTMSKKTETVEDITGKLEISKSEESSKQEVLKTGSAIIQNEDKIENLSNDLTKQPVEETLTNVETVTVTAQPDEMEDKSRDIVSDIKDTVIIEKNLFTKQEDKDVLETIQKESGEGVRIIDKLEDSKDFVEPSVSDADKEILQNKAEDVCKSVSDKDETLLKYESSKSEYTLKDLDSTEHIDEKKQETGTSTAGEIMSAKHIVEHKVEDKTHKTDQKIANIEVSLVETINDKEIIDKSKEKDSDEIKHNVEYATEQPELKIMEDEKIIEEPVVTKKDTSELKSDHIDHKIEEDVVGIKDTKDILEKKREDKVEVSEQETTRHMEDKTKDQKQTEVASALNDIKDESVKDAEEYANQTIVGGSDKLEDSKDLIIDKAEDAVGVMEQEVADFSKEVDGRGEDIKNKGGDTEQNLTNIAKVASKGLEVQTCDANVDMEKEVTKVDEGVIEKIQDFKHRAEDKIEALERNVFEVIEEVTKVAEDVSDKTEDIKNRAEDKVEALQQKVTEITKEVIGKTEDLKYEGKSNIIDIEQKAIAATTEISDKKECLEDKMTDKIVIVDQKISDISKPVCDQLSDAKVHLEDKLDTTARKIDQEVTEISGEVSKKEEDLKDIIHETIKIIDKKTIEITDSLKDSSENIIDSAKQSIINVADEISSTKKELENKVNDSIEKSAGTGEKLLDEKVKDVSDKIAYARDVFDERSSYTGKIVEEKSTKLIDKVSDIESGIVTQVSKTTDEILDDLKHTETEIIESVQLAKDEIPDKKDSVVHKSDTFSQESHKTEENISAQLKDPGIEIKEAVQEQTKNIIEGVSDTKTDHSLKSLDIAKDDADKTFEGSKYKAEQVATNIDEAIAENIEKPVVKRKDSLVDKLEEGITSTIDAISSFGKTLFGKNEKHGEPESTDILKETVKKEQTISDNEKFEDVIISKESPILNEELTEKSPPVLKSDAKDSKSPTSPSETTSPDLKDKLILSEVPKTSEDHTSHFDKSEKLPEDREIMDEKTLEKEHILQESANDLEETFEMVSDITKSVIFDKCEKPLSEKEKIDEQMFLEKSAEDFRDNFKTVEEMTKSISSKLRVLKGETGLEKSQDVPEKEPKSFQELEKVLEDSAKDIKETTDYVEDMSKSVIFEKCDTKSRTKPITEETAEKITEDLENSFDAVADMSKSVIFEKCDKKCQKEKSDEEKEVSEKKVTDREKFHEKTAETDISPRVEELCVEERIIEQVDIKMGESESRTSSERLLSEKLSSESISDSSKSIELEKGEKETMEKGKKEVDIMSQSKIFNDSDIKDLNNKESLPSLENKHLADIVDSKTPSTTSLLSVVEPQGKKLSVSDVEISLTEDKASEAEKTESEKLGDKVSPSNKETIDKDISDTLVHEKHIPGSVTPPTVPVSPNIADVTSDEVKLITKAEVLTKEVCLRSSTPASDDFEIVSSTQSDMSSDQMSKIPIDGDRLESDEEDQLSVTSQVAHSRDSSHYEIDEDTKKGDTMSMSFYGTLPGDTTVEKQMEPTYLYEITKAKYSGKSTIPTLDETKLPAASAVSSEEIKDEAESLGKPLGLLPPPLPTYLFEVTKAKYGTGIVGAQNLEESSQEQVYIYEREDMMMASFYGELPSDEDEYDIIQNWGKPLGLPSPAPPSDNKGTPKKERKLPANVTAKNKLNDDRKRAESPSKYNKNKKINPVYVDLTYVPHHGNSYYSYVDFFRRVRARYYVFSGIEPSREVYNALLEAKQTWEEKDLEVTIIPTYDTDVLGYWVAENEDLLTKHKIDLSPSASRCTINLQDHETSCSAYRLEF